MPSGANMGIIGNLHAAVLMGVTDPSVDTALATLCPNPFGHSRVLPLLLSGEGVYIEDDGTVRPGLSGIVDATVDVRSSVASAAFVVILVDLQHRWGALFPTDHSATTT